jgi:hypothetical protein
VRCCYGSSPIPGYPMVSKAPMGCLRPSVHSLQLLCVARMPDGQPSCSEFSHLQRRTWHPGLTRWQMASSLVGRSVQAPIIRNFQHIALRILPFSSLQLLTCLHAGRPVEVNERARERSVSSAIKRDGVAPADYPHCIADYPHF